MPLERKTPLQRKTPLRNSRTTWEGKKKAPFKKEGVFTLRWKSWRNKNREIAVERAAGKCEWHHGTCQQPVFWHHIFGRGNWTGVSEPWASFHPLTTMVCQQIHEQAHSDLRVRKIMQREALNRFLITEPFNRLVNWGEVHERYLTWEPQQILTSIFRELDQKGVRPDALDNPQAEPG